MSEIVAKARYKGGELVGVTATVKVPIAVPVNLYEDGTYTIKTRGDSIEFSVDDLETAINREYDDDALQEAYESSLEIDLENGGLLQADDSGG